MKTIGRHSYVISKIFFYSDVFESNVLLKNDLNIYFRNLIVLEGTVVVITRKYDTIGYKRIKKLITSLVSIVLL